MAKLNWNRPNGGYEMEPWDRRRFENQFKPSGITQEIRFNNRFIRGKYLGELIGTVVMKDPTYCVWILDNQPNSIVAKQIIKHFNKE